MTKFHEGQDVEVQRHRMVGTALIQEEWCRAKIVSLPHTSYSTQHQAQFPDGTRAVFDAGHIRAVRSDLQDSYDDCHQCGDVS